MKASELCIPVALQLFLDDVGWFYGRDCRWENEPSRTGIPREHVLEDHIAINEVGRACGMKIGTAWVIGDWDVNRVLAKVPLCTWQGENWQGSKHFNREEAEKIRDFVNGAAFIDVSVHGLQHDVFFNGVNIGGQEFFIPEGYKKGGKRQLAPEDYIRAHLDAFFEIYESWGFSKKPRNFVSPGGPSDSWQLGTLAAILRDYGILTWCNHISSSQGDGCVVNHGVIFNKKAIELCPWEAYDVNPDRLPLYDPKKAGIIGGHWPNILRYDPSLNLENVGKWKAFMDRECEVFGLLRSQSIEFAHCQQVYHYYGKITEQDGSVILDMSEADAVMPPDMARPFYISVRRGAGELSCEGGICTLYERKKGFDNYKIERADSPVVKLSR